MYDGRMAPLRECHGNNSTAGYHPAQQTGEGPNVTNRQHTKATGHGEAGFDPSEMNTKEPGQ